MGGRGARACCAPPGVTATIPHSSRPTTPLWGCLQGEEPPQKPNTLQNITGTGWLSPSSSPRAFSSFVLSNPESQQELLDSVGRVQMILDALVQSWGPSQIPSKDPALPRAQA